MKNLLLILTVSLLLALSAAAQQKPLTVEDVIVPDDIAAASQFPERKITGKVVGVHDGDTATVLDANKTPYKFRFNGIDAPELKMDFGNRSKENLSDWIFGKEVTVVYSKIDKYGRYVGTIFINGTDVNLEQIKAGMAWHYKKYSGEQSEKDRLVILDDFTGSGVRCVI